ncbi:hypothetical protein [Pantoea sp. SJZ147]|uniref:hypothetical protein n=1 Tax=Pantoea sp. SJZ147 TaxID=2572896 RepID=UPI0011AC79F9|nr:hypothetical protein [Pantoea sp. SJZ147]TWD41936.1 hypothetical protein FBY13_104295 [Pantoea sp. SJZ147]
MQAIILTLLLVITLLVGAALCLWHKHGWRSKKHLIVMLIVLAAAVQLINVKLLMTGQ